MVTVVFSCPPYVILCPAQKDKQKRQLLQDQAGPMQAWRPACIGGLKTQICSRRLRDRRRTG